MQASAQKVWVSVQQSIQSMVSPELYKLWFKNIRPKNFDHDCLTLEVENDFCEVWLEKNYLDLIREKAILASGRPIKVRLEVGNAQEPNAADNAMRSVTPKAEPELIERATPSATRELPFNPRNTFDTFVVGGNNQFAHGAALAVAQAPGKSYNPLFLYGGVGLGKTHLLHAIGQHVASHKKAARVAYVSSEKFTNEFIDAIQNNNLIRFRKRYRQTDVLLIDDIQFLSGKERIQEEFFHTFNALHESHKQIVLTCDRPPNEIQGLEQRLVSRFEWGLSTDLQPPDVETRVAILRKKEKAMGVRLPDEVLNFIAERIRTNIRRLEGALTRVACYVSLTNTAITVERAEALLRELLQEEGRHTISIEVIQKRVAEHFDIRIADMTSRRRPENIAFPRQIAMYLARQLTDSSLNVIGEAFGGRDHGTVLHAFRLVKGRMEVDGQVRQTVSFLEKQLMR
ncbi:MAG TPA: chromosomal replication initiator protein DnaA [Methylomirabilota bacterium]|nr:chromosomal replication initiator protein DnaA [Methylomirabilota bacterium]